MTDIGIEENVVVHNVGGRELKVDIFRPANTPGPVQGLLFLPGGGWQTANRAPLKDRYWGAHGRAWVRLRRWGVSCDG